MSFVAAGLTPAWSVYPGSTELEPGLALGQAFFCVQADSLGLPPPSFLQRFQQDDGDGHG